jgi:hypothetical protein
MPSPLGSRSAPRSTVLATPVAGLTLNSLPVLLCTISSDLPSGVVSMPLLLNWPGWFTKSPVSGMVVNVAGNEPYRPNASL